MIVMEIYETNSGLILENTANFNLKQIFDCGQCFRWDAFKDGYIGIAYGKPLYITQNGAKVTLHGATAADWQNVWRRYFDADRDYSEIIGTLSKDSVIRRASDFGNGIRILNQEPFECLISFIISASNNIPRIKKIIGALCENFGNRIDYMGKAYYTFPTPERIAELDLSELAVIKAGFRDKYILNASRAVCTGQIDLDALKTSSADYAKSQLLKLTGVGDKVADCVMLFSLDKHERFPVDVWIKRITEHCYFDGEQNKETISAFAEEKFGSLGGYAQQYLFYWARENKIGI